jgi:hypothetical protein
LRHKKTNNNSFPPAFRRAETQRKEKISGAFSRRTKGRIQELGIMIQEVTPTGGADFLNPNS